MAGSTIILLILLLKRFLKSFGIIGINLFLSSAQFLQGDVTLNSIVSKSKVKVTIHKLGKNNLESYLFPEALKNFNLRR